MMNELPQSEVVQNVHMTTVSFNNAIEGIVICEINS